MSVHEDLNLMLSNYFVHHREHAQILIPILGLHSSYNNKFRDVLSWNSGVQAASTHMYGRQSSPAEICNTTWNVN